MARSAPLRSSGDQFFEAVPGPAQLKLRMHTTMLHLSAVRAPSACYLQPTPADIATLNGSP
eukprot:15428462-Alexandrium_andersonii.AAC.1